MQKAYEATASVALICVVFTICVTIFSAADGRDAVGGGLCCPFETAAVPSAAPEARPQDAPAQDVFVSCCELSSSGTGCCLRIAPTTAALGLVLEKHFCSTYISLTPWNLSCAIFKPPKA